MSASFRLLGAFQNRGQPPPPATGIPSTAISPTGPPPANSSTGSPPANMEMGNFTGPNLHISGSWTTGLPEEQRSTKLKQATNQPRKKSVSFTPFFGDLTNGQDTSHIAEGSQGEELMPASKRYSSRTGPQKQAPYSQADRDLLKNLLQIHNKNGIINSAKQDAGTKEKKDKAWGQVVKDFNSSSGRPHPSTKKQLQKISSSMKSHDRAKSDAQHEVALKKFRQSCSQTGGGTGSEPPPEFDPDDPSQNSMSSDDDEDDQSFTNYSRPLMTRFDDTVAPQLRPEVLEASEANKHQEQDIQMRVVDGIPKFFETRYADEELSGSVQPEESNDSFETLTRKSRVGQKRSFTTKTSSSSRNKANHPISTGRESTNEFFKREAEATISYLDERKKNEQVKDDLSVAALKAAIRAHESEVEANEAKKAAYEAKAAWYRFLLEKQGSNYPAPPPFSYSPEWQK